MGLLSSSLSIRELARLCHNLATLHDGGVPMNRALRALEERGAGRAERDIARDLRRELEAGATFAQAVDRHRKRLSPLFVHMIEIAECTGTLSTALPQLSRYYDDLRRMYLGVMRQAAYPAALLAALFVGIPILKAFFSDVAGIADAPFEVQLFWILRDVGLRAGATFIAVIVAARLTLRFTTRESILMYCWPFSGLVRRILIARFAWAIMVFIRTGMPLHRAIELSGTIAGGRSDRPRF